MIHLIVGNTGSGKTTYSRQLEKNKSSLVFSIDQWNKTLFLPDKKSDDGLEWFLERIERAESMIMSLVLQLETSNVDAILDLGFSKATHREKFRAFAKKHDFEFQLHYLDIPKATRRQRVLSRNEQKGDTFEFEVSLEDFNFMESWFEVPSVDELVGSVVISE